MTKLTICIDLDDTLTQLLPAWLKWLNKKYELNVQVEDVTSWAMDKVFPTLTDNQVYEPLNTPEFWLEIEEKPDAAKYLKQLIEDGHDVYICTASFYKFVKFKYDNCLFRLFPFIKHKQIITCYNKQLINCDILIDDAEHNLRGGSYLGLLVDMPHNRKCIESFKLHRVHSWQEIYEYIKTLAERP